MDFLKNINLSMLLRDEMKNGNRKFNIKYRKRGAFVENRMKTKGEDCDHAIFPL